MHGQQKKKKMNLLNMDLNMSEISIIYLYTISAVHLVGKIN
jgi:hypothetical protein